MMTKKKASTVGKVAPTVYPEVGTFKVDKDLKKVYKKLTDAQLDEWLDLEGWTEEYNPTESEAINRMRKCMVILYHHFPKAPSKAKKNTGWKQFTIEDLLMIASERSAEYEFSDHEAILRMRVIMAIKATGYVAE